MRFPEFQLVPVCAFKRARIVLRVSTSSGSLRLSPVSHHQLTKPRFAPCGLWLSPALSVRWRLHSMC